MRGTVELVTSASTGTLEETFTGRAAGRGSGTLHLAESFTLDTTENLATHTRIVGGSGDFAGSRGRVGQWYLRRSLGAAGRPDLS